MMPQPGNIQEIGNRLRKARNGRGLTQYALAKQMGVGQGWLSELERGTQTHIQADTVVRLCLALAVSADYLLGLSADPTPPRRSRRLRSAYVSPGHPA